MKRSHKKRLFGAAALAGAAFLGTCIWALQSTLGVSQYEVALPQGMEGLDGYRIVQIADLHSAKLDQELEQALEGSVWSGRMVSAHKKAVSSLNIVITGSTPGAGATHLAFGLCTILTKMGIKVLYEEKNQTGALRRMAEKEGVTRMDHFGIYHIRGCQMKPWYGPAIRLEEKTDVQVIIKDFGTDWEDAARELKEEKHFLAAVISENLWEYGNAKRMLEIMKISGNNKEIPVFFIWRHRHRKKGADMTLGCSPVLFCTPEYADPFHPGPEGAGFLTSLFNCIQEHCIQKTAKDRMGAKRRFPWSIQHRLWG